MININSFLYTDEYKVFFIHIQGAIIQKAAIQGGTIRFTGSVTDRIVLLMRLAPQHRTVFLTYSLSPKDTFTRALLYDTYMVKYRVIT